MGLTTPEARSIFARLPHNLASKLVPEGIEVNHIKDEEVKLFLHRHLVTADSLKLRRDP